MSTSNPSLTRRSLLGSALGAAVLARVHAQPSEPTARIHEAFDFDWKFFKGDAAGAQQAGFADADWRTLDLPHDWSVEGPFGDLPNFEGFSEAWYRGTGVAMIQSDEQMLLAEQSVANLRKVLLQARRVHSPQDYSRLAEPILLEIQQREQEILEYLGGDMVAK